MKTIKLFKILALVVSEVDINENAGYICNIADKIVENLSESLKSKYYTKIF